MNIPPSTEQEYSQYELAMQRLDALMGMNIPRVTRAEYDDMRELLEARLGVLT